MANKVYTKKGDNGTTSLLSGRRIPKTMPEIRAVGVLDELNSFIGLLRSELHNSFELLEDIQWNLFNAGSIIINDTNVDLPKITQDDIEKLENWMDEMNEELPELKNFILPKGSTVVSIAHICRTICRRAEIEVLECKTLDTFEKFHDITVYLNRLSDLFFVLARHLGNKEDIKETIWKN